MLLLLLALGVACTVWLISGVGREVEPPEVSDGERDLRAPRAHAPAPPPVVGPLRMPDDSLLGDLARWARTPEEHARWKSALQPGTNGLGPFGRRLWIGDLLEHVWQDLETGRLTPGRAGHLFAELYEAGVLRLERTPRTARSASLGKDCDIAQLRAALRDLTQPLRSRWAFTLHGFESDPLATGRDLRLRVWTPRGQAVAPARVEATTSLLRRLDVAAGVESRASIDVLATAARGDDVFPTLRELPFPFIGVYLPADRLAVVGTEHPPEQFRRLLQHEVIHAWHRAARPDWRTTFTVEGLATYGSHLEPSDKGLAVPALRLRNDLAWLLHTIDRLQAIGLQLEQVHLRVLVRARSWEFYSLGWFAYAIAEACFAYLGADVVEAALRAGGEEALLVRCESIQWPELMRWMEERSAGGAVSEAWFVTESPLPGEEGPSDDTPDPVLLADLGLEVPHRKRGEVAALLRGRRHASGAGRPVSPAGLRQEPAASAQGPRYLGPRNCKKCHFRHHRSWRRSPHARAYALLAPGEAVESKRAAGLNPERDFRSGNTCLECHTTGYGTPSGYPAPRAGEPLTDELKRRAKEHAGVGCEACHGPGSDYAPYKKENEDYLRPDLAALGANVPLREKHCTGCHTPGCPTMPSDYVFDFLTAKRSDRLHEHVPLRQRHEAGER